MDVPTMGPIIRRIPLEELSRFAGDLATCLAAGIRVPEGLRTCTRSSATAVLPQIGAGEQAGKLEDAFAAISRATAESVQFRLRAFQQVFFRIVTFVVTLSIAGTLLSLIMAMRAGG